jgi:hypothetical protein
MLAGQTSDETHEQVALSRVVTRDYFSTVGARLREGRFFDLSDRRSESPAAIVNESFANRHFPGRSPLGERFKFGSFGEKGYWYSIVGVVKGDSRSRRGGRTATRYLSPARTSGPKRGPTERHRRCAPLSSRRRLFRRPGKRSGPSIRTNRRARSNHRGHCHSAIVCAVAEHGAVEYVSRCSRCCWRRSVSMECSPTQSRNARTKSACAWR